MFIVADENNLIQKGESISQKISMMLKEREELVHKLRKELIGKTNREEAAVEQASLLLESIRTYNLIIL